MILIHIYQDKKMGFPLGESIFDLVRRSRPFRTDLFLRFTVSTSSVHTFFLNKKFHE